MEDLHFWFKKLMVIEDAKGRLHTAVELASQFAGCKRCCMILENDKKELYIAQGVPDGEHGIGQIISEKGGRFHHVLMNLGIPAFISDPLKDIRTSYMRDLIIDKHIKSILFAPLIHENCCLGLMAFDFLEDEVKNYGGEFYEKIRPLLEIIAVCVVREKVYQKRKLESEKKDNLLALGTRVAELVHILKNSYLKIGGYSKLIMKKMDRDSLEDKDKIREDFYVITEEIERMKELTNNTLELLKISPEKLDFEEYEINQFLLEESKKFFQSFGKMPCKFEFVPDRKLNRQTLALDKSSFTTCIDELLKNATDAKPKKITLRTRIKPNLNEALIVVTNDGDKISPEILDVLFDPFMTTKQKGTGLGLPLVKTIINAHGGEITVNHQPLTRFTIRLPLSLKS